MVDFYQRPYDRGGILAIIVPPIAGIPSPSLSVGFSFLAVAHLVFGWTREAPAACSWRCSSYSLHCRGRLFAAQPGPGLCRSRSVSRFIFSPKEYWNSFWRCACAVGGFRLVVHRWNHHIILGVMIWQAWPSHRLGVGILVGVSMLLARGRLMSLLPGAAASSSALA